MTTMLTIKQVEKRQSDFIKGQKWKGIRKKYYYRCKRHGRYHQLFSDHNTGCPKCSKDRRASNRQTPGKSWTFKCGHIAMLPKKRGKSNKQAYYNANNWMCGICRKEYSYKRNRGEGEQGLIGRMIYKLSSARCRARKNRFLPSDITAEKMVEMWTTQKGRCAACNEPVELLGLKTHFDHNHSTGEARGFIHSHCNTIEGHAKNMPASAIRKLAEYCISGTFQRMFITVGNLVDQLTITNLRIWKAEDTKRNLNATDKQIADATKITNIANQQRNDLIQAIDQELGQKSYEQGSTKIYGKS